MKKISFAAALTLFALISVAQTPQEAKQQSTCDQCTFLQDALKSVAKIKVGETRLAIETDFEMEGGMQVASTTRYWYKKCRYIKIDVSFDEKYIDRDYVSKTGNFSPNDVISKISKPYIAYPVMD